MNIYHIIAKFGFLATSASIQASEAIGTEADISSHPVSCIRLRSNAPTLRPGDAIEFRSLLQTADMNGLATVKPGASCEQVQP